MLNTNLYIFKVIFDLIIKMPNISDIAVHFDSLALEENGEPVALKTSDLPFYDQ